ncbi:MAG: hypothetical protein GX456_02475 [Verrucomicrobia bacterium]|nr:hypothetical protein [Verrucomicrobiota bacterium]
MTDRTTGFDHTNPASDHSPAGGGQECPRSYRRVGANNGARERGRPRPHQHDNRSYDQFRSRKSGARTFTGWVRRRIAALLHALEKATAPGARPSPAASTRQPILHLLQSPEPVARTSTGCGRPRMAALLHAVEKATARGARPSPAASTR